MVLGYFHFFATSRSGSRDPRTCSEPLVSRNICLRRDFEWVNSQVCLRLINFARFLLLLDSRLRFHDLIVLSSRCRSNESF